MIGSEYVLKPYKLQSSVVVDLDVRMKYILSTECTVACCLQTYKPRPESRELAYDIHFWIGSQSTQVRLTGYNVISNYNFQFNSLLVWNSFTTVSGNLPLREARAQFCCTCIRIVWSRTTKFGKVTHVGRSVFVNGQARPLSQGTGASVPPNF